MLGATASCSDSRHQSVSADWCLSFFFKEAFVKPLLKKPSLDPNNLKNCQSFFNFFNPKSQKIVLFQLSAQLNASNLFPTSQSACRPGHSTETALLGHLTVVTLLDLSAAFDTIDHKILHQRLEHLSGISGTSLNWFRSYLSNRTQTVTINSRLSQPTSLNFGVPQGSVLGPILFILYTKSYYTHSPTLHFFRRRHPAARYLPSRSNRHLSPKHLCPSFPHWGTADAELDEYLFSPCSWSQTMSTLDEYFF